MNRLVAIALGATLVFAGACGDDDDDDDTVDAAGAIDAGTPDAEAEVTVAEICDVDDGLYVDFFGKVFGCQSELFEILIGELPTDQELADLCVGNLQPFLDDGTTVLGDRAAYNACADYVANLDCADSDFNVPNVCDDVIVGQVALDDDCDAADQCAGDAFCDGGSNVTGIQAMKDKLTGKQVTPTGPTVCGTCTATLANGETCQGENECSSGYCKEIDMAPSECARLGDVGDACDDSRDCLGTRVCDTVSSLCANEPTWAVGTPCNTFVFDCGGVGGDLMCHGAGECRDWLELTDSCDPGMNPANFCRFFQYESCADIGGGVFQCVGPTIVAEGADCDFFTGEKCGAGLVCSDESGTCVPEAALGESCAGTTECEFFLNCVADSCEYSPRTGDCPAP